MRYYYVPVIVVDANVIVRGVRSQTGASGSILREMLLGVVPFALSPAVVFEYEDVPKRPGLLGTPPLASMDQVDIILDGLCARAKIVSPWFRYRPFLDDPKDD